MSGLTAIYLTEDDAQILREALTDFRLRNQGAGAQPTGVLGDSGETIFTPEVYVALLPEAGIPAMTGTTPGSASCTIYKTSVVGGVRVLVQTYFSQTVYNISETAIERSAERGDFKIVWRDKYGQWLTEGFPCAEL